MFSYIFECLSDLFVFNGSNLPNTELRPIGRFEPLVGFESLGGFEAARGMSNRLRRDVNVDVDVVVDVVAIKSNQSRNECER